jgi:hypothetical protein
VRVCVGGGGDRNSGEGEVRQSCVNNTIRRREEC